VIKGAGIIAIDMPLHSGGRPAAAISVSVPSVRFSSAQLREMLPAVRCCGCH
jgi:DNA-binding IclR family transcriptional regulator